MDEAPAQFDAPRTIFVASGKGGVGVSVVAMNLATALLQSGCEATVVDVAGEESDLLLLDRRLRLSSLDERGQSASAPNGLRVLLGDGGESARRLAAVDGGSSAKPSVRIIDGGNIADDDIVELLTLSELLLLVTTPEPTSLLDTYAALKAWGTRGVLPRVGVVANQVRSRSEADAALQRLRTTARQFLGHDVALAGVIPFDEAMLRAVRDGVPCVVAAPQSVAARAFELLARRITSTGAASEHESGLLERMAELFF